MSARWRGTRWGAERLRVKLAHQVVPLRKRALLISLSLWLSACERSSCSASISSEPPHQEVSALWELTQAPRDAYAWRPPTHLSLSKQERASLLGVEGSPLASERSSLPQERLELFLDEALSQGAREALSYLKAKGALPSPRLTQLFLESAGAAVWGPQLTLWRDQRPVSAAERRQRYLNALRRRSQEERQAPLSLGEAMISSGEGWLYLLIAAPQHLSLDPIKKKRDAERSTLTFTLNAHLHSPEAITLSPSGELSTLKVKPTAEGRYAVELLTSEEGQWQLELLAQGRYGLQPLAQLGFTRGAPPLARSYALELMGERLTDEQATHRLLALVQEARVSRGLEALKLDETLTRLSIQHAHDMTQEGYLGHRSPSKGSPRARLDQSGYIALKSGENIALNPTISGAHERLMWSLGHRRNLLDAQFTHLGLATQRTPLGWLVVETFAQAAPRYSAAQLPQLSDEVQAYLTRAIWGEERAHETQLTGGGGSRAGAEHLESGGRCVSVRGTALSGGALLGDVSAQLLEALTSTLSVASNSASAITPQALIQRAHTLGVSGELSAWVAQTRDLKALTLPSTLSSSSWQLMCFQLKRGFKRTSKTITAQGDLRSGLTLYAYFWSPIKTR